MRFKIFSGSFLLKTVTKKILFALIFLFSSFLIFLGLAFILIDSPLNTDIQLPVSPAFLDKDGQLFHARLSAKEEWCLPVNLADMGKWLPIVAVTVEDKRFYKHFGVDPLALTRALWQNLLILIGYSKEKFISGASTISSQVIRLSFPRQRNLKNKFIEFIQAVKLEAALPKHEILEMYLNLAPFGGPIRGVEAASLSYFGKQSKNLSMAEATLLIAMLRGPSLYNPIRNPEQTLNRRNFLLKFLYNSDYNKQNKAIDEQLLKYSLLEALPQNRGKIPDKYRHFADFCLRQLPNNYWTGRQKPLKTGLNKQLQILLEQSLKVSLLTLPEKITAAGAIVNNRTGELLAYVGNARFDLLSSKHWVDCGLAPRSPGSALKPFIYLKAIEQGLLVPQSLLADTPLSFAGQSPRNFDLTYRGAVTAHFALAYSLNAPAVRVLRLSGGEACLQLLRTAGFSYLNKPAAFYGDALALGGCEVNLIELLSAYMSLANLGLKKKIIAFAEQDSWQKNKQSNHRENNKQGYQQPGRQNQIEYRIFSAEAAWLINQILQDNKRLTPSLQEVFKNQNKKIAFKTGTSYNMRDAWTAAYNSEHSIVIWFGSPTGEFQERLVGLDIATPVALDILKTLPTFDFKANLNFESSAFFLKNAVSINTIPSRLERFWACALSGMPISKICPKSVAAWRIKGKTRKTPCTIHIWKNNSVQILWPRELAEFTTQYKEIVLQKKVIQITSPLADSKFLFSKQSQIQRIVLNCEGSKGKEYWFMDNNFIGTADKENHKKLFWTLTVGKHILSVVDEEGNSAGLKFEVINVDNNFFEPNLNKIDFLQESKSI